MSGHLVQADHLGGYIAGGDEATFFPDLWRWLVEEFGVRSVIDIGCGDGVALDHFLGLNCAVLGVEGTPQEHPSVVQHDYTLGAYEPPPPLRRKFEDDGWDLAWCCEFVEHVEEQYVSNFLQTFRSARLLLMTHADPGQPGYHHVTLKPRDFWVRQLASAGFVLDAGLTETTRALAGLNPSVYNHYLRSGLAFRRIGAGV